MRSRMMFAVLLVGLLTLAGATADRAAVAGPANGILRAAFNWEASSGIQGLAVIGPVTPLQRPGDPPGVPLPGARIAVQAASGGPVLASGRTDLQGHFRINLPAGRYLVVPLPPRPAPYPRALPQTVGVRPGKYSTLLIVYDSGLRAPGR